MRKPQAPEEIGVPISRNGSMPGPKLQNGCVSTKSLLGSPPPRLAHTPTHMPTLLEESGKKVKKQVTPQHGSPSLRTSQGSPGTSEPGSQRQSSWDSRDTVPSTSLKLLTEAAASGHRLKGEDKNADLEKGTSSGSSPEHSSGSPKVTQVPEGRTAHVCNSQGINCPTTGHSRVLPNGLDSKTVKLKPPVLGSTAIEPMSLMSPPPAKRLALSAKKVGVWGSRPWDCLGA